MGSVPAETRREPRGSGFPGWSLGTRPGGGTRKAARPMVAALGQAGRLSYGDGTRSVPTTLVLVRRGLGLEVRTAAEGFADAAFEDFLLEAVDGGGDGQRAEVAFEAVAEADGARFGVAGAYY